MKVYAALARDCKQNLLRNYKDWFDVSSSDDRLVICENDSLDGTRELIQELSEKDNRVHPVFLRKTEREKYRSVISFERAQYMSSLRNILKDYCFDVFPMMDYFVMFDVDLPLVFCKNIDSMFTSLPALASHGVYHRGNKKGHYDTWAYQPMSGEIFVKKVNGRDVAIDFPQIDGEEPIEVMSAFGGLAVYCPRVVKDCRYRPYEYNGLPTALCEHGGFSEEIRNKGHKIYINPNYNPSINPVNTEPI